jgi:hypothetical protein
VIEVLQIILVIVILAMAVVLPLRQHLVLLRYSAACRKWPYTAGRITSAPYNDDEPDHAFRLGKAGGAVAITYTYSVESEEYEGNTVSFNPELRKNPTLLRRAAELYRIGEEVPVYYHPKKPYLSVLKP